MTVTLSLNNSVQMPALGFGVFQTPPDVTADAVRTALQVGYRLIETKVWISDYGYDATLHARPR